MTAGLRTIGAIDSPSYFRKEWSGADGKYTNGVEKWNSYLCLIDIVAKTRGIGEAYPGWGAPGGWIPVNEFLSENGITWTANDDLRLYSKLAEQARGHQFNLGVAIAESKETMNMVTHNVRRFTGAVLALKRGRIDLAARHLGVVPPKRFLTPKGSVRRTRGDQKELTSKDVSSQWLELQYGWLPLLGDCYEGMKAFESHHNPARRTTIRVSSRVSRTYTVAAPPVYGGSPWSGTVTKHIQKRIICELTEQLSVPRSLGLEDPLTIAWEMVPFSFVADWFVPIGSYLDNLSIIPNLTGRFLVTTRRSGSGTAEGKEMPGGTRFFSDGTPPTYYSDKYWVKATAKASHLRVDRAVSTSISVPQPNFVGFQDAFSPKRLANAVSLLHQVLT